MPTYTTPPKQDEHNITKAIFKCVHCGDEIGMKKKDHCMQCMSKAGRRAIHEEHAKMVGKEVQYCAECKVK